MARRVDWQDVQAVLVRLMEASAAAGDPLREPIVLVGGSALAAHGVRADSVDVDIYAPAANDKVVHDVETELIQIYGPGFRLDVTGGENIWGNILLRDIASSPVVAEIEAAGARYVVRALRLEDVYLLKLNTPRKKDRDDLERLASHLTPERLIHRFNEVVRWHGDRHAVLGYSDLFVSSLMRLFGCEPMVIIQALTLQGHLKAELEATYVDAES